MTKIRMALADSLAEDFECGGHVIACVRVVEKQFDELFALAEDVLQVGDDDTFDRLDDFLEAQKIRFAKEDEEG